MRLNPDYTIVGDAPDTYEGYTPLGDLSLAVVVNSHQYAEGTVVLINIDRESVVGLVQVDKDTVHTVIKTNKVIADFSKEKY